jgi:hypothetical protein
MPHCVILKQGQLCMVRVLDPLLPDPVIWQQNQARAEAEQGRKQKRLLDNAARARKREEHEMR